MSTGIRRAGAQPAVAGQPDKPTAVIVPSDDCEVTVGGRTFFPHRGEQVAFFDGPAMGFFEDSLNLAQLQRRVSTDEDAAREFFDTYRRVLTLIAEAVDAESTTWTDDRGRAIQFDGTAAPLLRLRQGEVNWLVATFRSIG